MTKGKAKGGGKCFLGKENFQRMNFLYQAAHEVLARKGLKTDLPAYYGSSMLAIAQKSVLKIEPNVKRDLCKGCGNLLKPGVTAKVRVRSGNIIWTCLRCTTVKRYPSKKGYKLWIDRHEATLEIIEDQSSYDNLVQEDLKNGSVSQHQEKPSEKIQEKDCHSKLKNESHLLEEKAFKKV